MQTFKPTIPIMLCLLAACSHGAPTTRSGDSAASPHAASPAATTVAQSSATASARFRGTEYFLRGSQRNGDQITYQFTPAGQENEGSWTEMLTLDLYPSTHDGDGLANIANQVLAFYKAAHSIVMRTYSVPASAQKPAEHFMAVALPHTSSMDFAAMRFVLAGKQGAGLLYLHRFYGKKVGNPMSQWMAKNGPDIEQQLMQFDVAQMASSVEK